MKTKYQEAKQQLKEVSKNLKRDYRGDKPAIRMGINNAADAICKEYHYRLSDYQKELLHNYAVTLHQKN